MVDIWETTGICEIQDGRRPLKKNRNQCNVTHNMVIYNLIGFIFHSY